MTELECRLADVSVQLERALSKNATLEGRNQLLETFLGLQSKVSGCRACSCRRSCSLCGISNW